MTFHTDRRGLLALAGAALLGGSARAQGYPERPVKIVSISSAGTGVDDFTRLAAKYFSEKTGRSFYVENKPGANTALAADYVAKSPPDGYTLLLAAASTLVANPYMVRNLPYDPNKDLAPIARLSVIPIVLTVPAASPHRSLASLMEAARARPGKLNYGTSTAGYRAMTAAINRAFKVEALDVPYKGTSTMLPDLMTGTLDFALLEISQATPHVQAGRLRALAVSSPVRSAALPDVPTLAEAGAGDASLSSWLGLLAPAGTPQTIVERLARLSIEFVASPEAKAHFAQRGTAAYAGDPAELRKTILEDQARWKHYIAAAGIQPE